MQVKICGITTLDDARAAALAGADFIGLIRAPGPRQVSVTAAREIITALPPSARPVLVFRNAQVADVLAEAAMAGAVWIQLHGHEPLAYLEALQRQRPGLRLIKAWEVASPRAAEELRQYLASAVRSGVRLDAVLLDAPKGGAHPGYERLGDIARGCTVRPPAVWCAGGLTVENLATAVAVGLYDAVDVASGVEARPGVKDVAAMQRFVAAARPL